ncbi:MAG: alkaline phosphatase D family protein [Prolixibacteraceae bacterium]|jgi:phosphodiesterase/alkaline phosphatase D-like protein|nr:alkaline phosphatase D family protein [Prolixibacteraceae bacterium]
MINLKFTSILCLFLLLGFISAHSQVTHGPILGKPSDKSMGIWVRTALPGSVTVNYGLYSDSMTETIVFETKIEKDCSGWACFNNLSPNTVYYYRIRTSGSAKEIQRTFKTLPSGKDYYNEAYNKGGLFNFSFHLGHCSNQKMHDFSKGDISTFQIMNNQWKEKVNFGILNGDFIYEDARDTPVDVWQYSVGLKSNEIPDIVSVAPSVVGVWQNYKNYLDRSENLSKWHSYVPTFFTMDDHEVLGDFYGSGEIGRKDKKALFRDIGTQAWLDYIGWGNPYITNQNITFGKCQLKKGTSFLKDENVDFTKINLNETSNLHIHWGDSKEGAQNAGVYEINEVIDKNTLRISPSPIATENCSYSIGRQLYGKFSLGNCDFYFLDTKSNRPMHDTKNPSKSGLSMLGKIQYNWLLEEMKNSKADFHFVISTVSFMIPHTGTHGKIGVPDKDDSWTAFLWEREKLLNFFDGLGKKVFILTGDVHNSYSIKITDNVWEFMGGPLSSRNHLSSHLDNIPPTGDVNLNGRPFNIRWSSYFLPDIPSKKLHFPIFCIVQINNVFNNPIVDNTDRWVKYPNPQVVFQFYSGITGELLYAESVTKE